MNAPIKQSALATPAQQEGSDGSPPASSLPVPTRIRFRYVCARCQEAFSREIDLERHQDEQAEATFPCQLSGLDILRRIAEDRDDQIGNYGVRLP